MHNQKMVALVITTYNNPSSLALCLASLQNQTFKNFEVMVADDGSTDETRELLAGLKTKINFRMTHFWHPDQGYRKAKINNHVFSQINENQFPVIICIDHDVILHHRFIEDHYRIHRDNQFSSLLFMGRRVDLGPSLSARLNQDNTVTFNHGLGFLLIQSWLKGETKNILRSIRLDLTAFWLRILKRDRVDDLLGSNFSVTTALLKQVNGYNEDFQSYWGEDGDLFVRIRNTGARLIGRIGYAVQWHLHHERLLETTDHVALYKQLLLRTDYVRCKNGITK